MAAPQFTATPTINVFADKEGRNILVAAVKRDLITKHSKTIKQVLEDNPGRTDVVITGAAKGPLEHVIAFMTKGRQPLRIGVGHEPFPKIIAILQAVNALDVEPPQPQVEGHVIYLITQFKITAEQVSVIEQASARLGKDGRIYKAMVQAVAYNVVHGGFAPEHKAAIRKVVLRFPDLDSIIEEKIAELKRRGEEHARLMAEKEAAKEARRYEY